jgi:hypothetical protein
VVVRWFATKGVENVYRIGVVAVEKEPLRYVRHARDSINNADHHQCFEVKYGVFGGVV